MYKRAIIAGASENEDAKSELFSGRDDHDRNANFRVIGGVDQQAPDEHKEQAQWRPMRIVVSSLPL